MILRDALEAAASTDRDKVNTAIRAMDSTTGAATLFPGGRVKFDERGRREGAALVIAQWQNGVPVSIFPADSAVAQPIWPRR
jgi:branched-chain amino acid transport system substrate-binding protein